MASDELASSQRSGTSHASDEAPENNRNNSAQEESKFEIISKKHDGKPFLEFGVAIESFLNLELSLIRLFAFLTFLACI